MKDGGADHVGVAVDAATPLLLINSGGRGWKSHRWSDYWNVVQWSVATFGRFHAGIHLIVGLGETEKEMSPQYREGRMRAP